MIVKKSNNLLLDPKDVGIGWRARTDIGAIDELAHSIQTLGQLQPIVVMSDGKDGYSLIAGFRRLKACQSLGIKVKAHVIAPDDAASELVIQFDENMKRKDFDSLEQAEWLAKYKAIYEKMHPETKRGATARGRSKVHIVQEASLAADAAAVLAPAPRFTLVAADRFGFSERKVQELLDLTSLPPKMKRKIDACQKPSEREKTLQECLKTVRQARKLKRLEKIAEEKQQAAQLEENERPAIIFHEGDNKDYLKGEGLYDLILTDPPYDRERSLIGHVARSSIGKKIKWDSLDIGWVMSAAAQLTDGGQMLVFCPLEAIGSYELAFGAAGLEYRGAILWHKSNAGTVYRNAYMPACEAIVWATKGGNYVFAPWEEQAGAVAHNVIAGPICGGKERLNHETQKPEWLVEKLIRRHSVDGFRVFDPFAGVATTLVVCKRLGLYAVGVEIDEAYVKAGRARLAATFA
jgi:ParB/RepB/Spo0J family partition protein